MGEEFGDWPKALIEAMEKFAGITGIELLLNPL